MIDDTRGLVAPLLRSDSGEDLATVLDGLPLAESSVRRLAAEAIPLLDQADPALLMAMCRPSQALLRHFSRRTARCG